MHRAGSYTPRAVRGFSFFSNSLVQEQQYDPSSYPRQQRRLCPSARFCPGSGFGFQPDSSRKPGALSVDEFERMKLHTLIGDEIIAKIQAKTSEKDFFQHARMFALYHHEKWDGTGYPMGLRGEAIPLAARLMAIIDVYDALISERPYKKAFTHEEALRIIAEGKGTHFDPVLTELFLDTIGNIPSNTGLVPCNA